VFIHFCWMSKWRLWCQSWKKWSWRSFENLWFSSGFLWILWHDVTVYQCSGIIRI